jgi:hypothetical protein
MMGTYWLRCYHDNVGEGLCCLANVDSCKETGPARDELGGGGNAGRISMKRLGIPNGFIVIEGWYNRIINRQS